jgi:hypothetical protein
MSYHETFETHVSLSSSTGRTPDVGVEVGDRSKATASNCCRDTRRA